MMGDAWIDPGIAVRPRHRVRPGATAPYRFNAPPMKSACSTIEEAKPLDAEAQVLKFEFNESDVAGVLPPPSDDQPAA